MSDSKKLRMQLQCPMPKLDFDVITLGHGSGGTLTNKLLDTGVFDLLSNDILDKRHDGAFLEMAEYGTWQMVFVDKVAKTVEVKDDENKRFTFLTLRGFLDYPEASKWVEVDHGAIPFLMNGADCMVAGVQAADDSIVKGELVWIRDELWEMEA